MNFKFYTLLLVVLTVSSCVESGVKRVTPQRVKCEEARGLEKEINISYPGKVTAAADVNLSFRVAGVIDRIVVREGDLVREGQAVAYMDSRDYKLQLDATQAEYDAIKGEVDRIVALYEDQSVSQNDYEKAVSGLRQITSKLSAHRNAYEDTSLKAPFDGYIQKINFERGEAVSAGMPIVKFISAKSPEVVVNIPVEEYLRREDLNSASAVVNTYPNGSFGLTPIGVSHKANLNQLYEMRFRITANKEGAYPPLGTSAMVTLNYAGAKGSKVSIPFSAIVQRESQSYVWILEKGVVSLKKVELGAISRDGRVEVLYLEEGTLVITAGVNTLKEGQRVEPLDAPSKSNVGNIL